MCNQRVPLSGFPIFASVCSRLKPNDYSSIVSLSVGAAGVLVGHPFDTVKVGNNNVIAIFSRFFFLSPHSLSLHVLKVKSVAYNV